MNSLKNVSLEQSWYGPLFMLRILSLIKILTNLFSFLSFFSFDNFFLIFVNLLLTSRKAPVFLFSFSFTLSLRFLPNGAKCFYMPFWDNRQSPSPTSGPHSSSCTIILPWSVAVTIDSTSWIQIDMNVKQTKFADRWFSMFMESFGIFWFPFDNFPKYLQFSLKL